MHRAFFLSALLWGCSSTDSVAPAVPASGSSTSPGSTSSSSEGVEPAAPDCSRLFGRPGPSTGLTSDQCAPSCPCADGWTAPEYTDADIGALHDWVLETPFDELLADPYETPDAFVRDEGSVCGVVTDGTTYRLETFADDDAASARGAKVTHDGACGRCSTLQDLAVYMANEDLTDPVRDCGLLGLSQGDEANLECLLELGFTRPCAQIWFYNTKHTGSVCLDECVAALGEPYHLPDGSLNPCLVCDEEHSGPVFKAVAGRTRRNTGLASALCRPCDEVRRVEHRYGQ